MFCWGVPRFKLLIEYAGTRYSGWQIQNNARTVQGEIDRAVREVSRRREFELYGSGRTDAGVHALGQVAHLELYTDLPPETLRRRLNDELPADINILSAVSVPHRFHARHNAVAQQDQDRRPDHFSTEDAQELLLSSPRRVAVHPTVRHTSPTCPAMSNAVQIHFGQGLNGC